MQGECENGILHLHPKYRTEGTPRPANGTFDEAIRSIESTQVDAFIVDLNLDHVNKSGSDFLQVALDRHPKTPVAIVSAFWDDTWAARLARFFVQRGPYAIQLQKPVAEKSLEERADAVLLSIRDRHVARSEPDHAADPRVGRLLSDILPVVAASNLPVLILGETGTGKENLARLIHESDENPHPSGRFLPVNCAAISDTLILSELFGHVKNSFTGAEEHRLGVFLEASGWKHEPVSARKTRRAVMDDLLKRFGLKDVDDLYGSVIVGGDFKAQKEEIDGFITDINDLVKKLGVMDDYVAWLPALRDRKAKDGQYEWVVSLNRWAAEDGMVLDKEGLARFVRERTESEGGRLWEGNWRELRHIYARAKTAAERRPANQSITQRDLEFASQWVLGEGSHNPREIPDGGQPGLKRWTLEECVRNGRIVRNKADRLYKLLALLFEAYEAKAEVSREQLRTIGIETDSYLSTAKNTLRKRFAEYPESGWYIPLAGFIAPVSCSSQYLI